MVLMAFIAVLSHVVAVSLSFGISGLIGVVFGLSLPAGRLTSTPSRPCGTNEHG